jgi:hypothetical protein
MAAWSGRLAGDFEPLTERPGFRASKLQIDWLREASRAHGFVNLSDWLRHLAIASGEPKLGKPFPLLALRTPTQESPLTPGKRSPKRPKRLRRLGQGGCSNGVDHRLRGRGIAGRFIFCLREQIEVPPRDLSCHRR